MEPDDEPGGTDPPPGRTWVHPSELGHHTRVRRDHRLARVVLLGVVAMGAGAWLASAMVASMAETGDRTDAYGMRESHVLMVQPTNGDAVPAAAVVVDDNGHLAVSSTEFVPGTTVRVLCGEKYKSASVVRHDSDTGLAILKLDDPYGSPSNPSLVDVGDPVNLVAYPDGTRAMNQATVTSGVLDAAALVETTVVSTHTTETSTTTTEPDLRVMAITDGSAEAIEALPGAAVTTSGGQVVGLVVAAGPVAGMVEPLDGVRRRAAMMLED